MVIALVVTDGGLFYAWFGYLEGLLFLEVPATLLVCLVKDLGGFFDAVSPFMRVIDIPIIYTFSSVILNSVQPSAQIHNLIII